MKASWRTSFGVFGLVSALAAAGCAGGSGEGPGGDGSGPLVYWASLPLSGPIATLGKSVRAGIEASVQDVNEAGGINGRKVKLKVVNGQGQATKAVSRLQRALNSDNPPDFVYGGTVSDVSLAMCPILQREKIVAVGQTGAGKLRNLDLCGYTFSTVWTAPAAQRATASFLNKKGVDSVGVLVVNAAFGKSAAKGAKEAYPAAGIKVTGTEAYAPDAVDVSSQLKRLKRTNPDVIMLEGFGGAGTGAVLTSRRKVAPDIPLVGAAGTASTSLRNFVGPNALGGVSLVSFAVSVDGKEPAPKRLEQVLPGIKQQLDAEAVSNVLGVFVSGYDALMVIKEGIEAAGSAEGPAVRKALEGFAANPPKDPMWVARANYAYTSKSHFSEVQPSDFAAGVPSKLNPDGQIQPFPEGVNLGDVEPAEAR